jgi:hypothetical protein
LDGSGPPPDADAATRAEYDRAAADVAAIARALGMIGDTLAAEPAPADAAGVVVPLRRRRTRWMFAAAASLVGVIAVGTLAVVQHQNGAGSNSSVAQAPPSAAPMAAPNVAAPPAPAPRLQMAPATPESAAGAAAAPASKSASDTAAGPDFDAAVACARGIVLGRVVSLTPTGQGGYRLSVSVQEWIAPVSGPGRVSWAVGGAPVSPGQQRVLIVPQDPAAQVLAYADSPALRSRITQAQHRAAGHSCS